MTLEQLGTLVNIAACGRLLLQPLSRIWRGNMNLSCVSPARRVARRRAEAVGAVANDFCAALEERQRGIPPT